MKYKQFIFILTPLLFIVSCNPYGTKFTANNMDKHYEIKTPCDALFTMKVDPETLEKYDFIGVCKSHMPSGGVNGKKNTAIKMIQKCACQSGGDLIRIIDVNESVQLEERWLSPALIRLARTSYNDSVVAEVFRKKDE